MVIQVSKATRPTEPPGPDVAAKKSPYLSLREAVQPAIFAHRLLASRAGQLGDLGRRAGELLAATQELLETTGQIHLAGGDRARGMLLEAADLLATTTDLLAQAGLGELVSPDPGPRTSADDDLDGSGLAAAYAHAGLQWTKIVGAALALGDDLTAQSRWTDVERLAAALDQAGEAKSASQLLDQAKDAKWTLRRQQLRSIHSRMNQDEIREAFALLEMVLQEVPPPTQPVAYSPAQLQDSDPKRLVIGPFMASLATSIALLAGETAPLTPSGLRVPDINDPFYNARYYSMGVNWHTTILENVLASLATEFFRYPGK
jgi:hypothetical protein